ncbi:hypothetical protein [Cerasicoccus arenae]|uniref:Uncharacterized protein n=1 Tax=Cerasicoccus arenae TaxID=424488 RepID=A0A8J3DE97_9BACT|nr:hypothetical protein [Cerasicoccus arenae]MBK1858386.1 hypothetical protein [Cerasicoccus arenae]GHC09946.1 hypothetical protein GCM10007047_29150 [Cerasicoccus arenae]
MMTLKSIEQLDGQRCALLELNFEATGNMYDDSGQNQISMVMQGEIHRSFELFEDIKVDFTGSMEIVSKPQEGVIMVIEGLPTPRLGQQPSSR